MGKASSTKKVARAARAGGGRVRSGQPRSLLFPGTLLLVSVLGIALIVYARNDRQDEDLGGTPQLGEHIHLAFGVHVCGEWLPDIPTFESPVGIHTHGDGVIHTHPFSQLGVGANATLGRYFQDGREGEPPVELDLDDNKITYLGEEYEEGETECDGVDEPSLRVAYWENVADPTAEPVMRTGDYADLTLQQDGAGITIFYGDPDADVPKPPTSANLAELGAADGGSTLIDPETGQTTTSAPAAPAGSSTTAAATPTTAAESSPTTAAP